MAIICVINDSFGIRSSRHFSIETTKEKATHHYTEQSLRSAFGFNGLNLSFGVSYFFVVVGICDEDDAVK